MAKAAKKPAAVAAAKQAEVMRKKAEPKKKPLPEPEVRGARRRGEAGMRRARGASPPACVRHLCWGGMRGRWRADKCARSGRSAARAAHA